MALRLGLKAGAAGLAGGMVVTTVYYRPTPYSDPPKDALAEHAHEAEPLLMALTRRLLFLVGTVGCKALLQVANTCRITKDEHYAAFLRAVEARGSGTPLITVSNHACPLDDPCMLAALVPFRLAALKPELMRFTICSQDICFKNGVLESFFGAAKVMPIARGEGIDQRLLQNMQCRLASGAWCHIFPEGSCFQTGSLSGRTGEGRQRLGRLKWGVGKLIAHAPCPPVVFPLFHTGMQGVTPLHPNSRKVISMLPQTGNFITIRCGAAVDFSDLMAAHEAANGKLRRCCDGRCARGDGGSSSGGSSSGSSSSGSSSSGGGSSGSGVAADAVRSRSEAPLPPPVQCACAGTSTAAEMRLYSAITRRLEDALLALEAEARLDLGEKFPGLPPQVTRGRSSTDFDPETGRLYRDELDKSL